MKNYLSVAAALMFWIAFSGTASANTSCNIELDSDIAISDKVIRISKDGRDLVLSNTNRLYVDYEEVSLSDEQRQAVEAYAGEIRKTIPEIVTLALEGVEIALSALSEVGYGLFDAEPPSALTRAIDEINTKVKEQVRYENGEYFIAGGELSGIDSAMTQIEPAMESAIAASIGQFFTNIGSAFMNGGDLDVNIDEMTTRLESMGERIEARVEEKADKLKARADTLCGQMKTLASTEQDLHSLLPELRPYGVVRL